MTDQPTPQGESASDQIWEQGWDGHKKAQQERLANLSLPEKLACLEEAHRLVMQIKKSAARPNGASSA